MRPGSGQDCVATATRWAASCAWGPIASRLRPRAPESAPGWLPRTPCAAVAVGLKRRRRAGRSGGILEHIAFDGVMVLGHKGGVLTACCFRQHELEQASRALTQEALAEGDTVGFSGSRVPGPDARRGLQAQCADGRGGNLLPAPGACSALCAVGRQGTVAGVSEGSARAQQTGCGGRREAWTRRSTLMTPQPPPRGEG